jgi:hypothetical protein
MWCCFKAQGMLFFIVEAQTVGWVEQSETHHKCDARFDGFRSRSTHPTDFLCDPSY